MSEETQKIATSEGNSPVDLKARFAELLDDAKRNILAHVQDSIGRFMPILKIMRPALRAVERALSVRIQLLQRLLH